MPSPLQFKPVLKSYERIAEACKLQQRHGTHATALIVVRDDLGRIKPNQRSWEWRRLREIEYELERLIEQDRRDTEKRIADETEERRQRRIALACKLLRSAGREGEAALIEEEEDAHGNEWSALEQLLKVSVTQLDRMAERARTIPAMNTLARAAHRLDQFRVTIMTGPALVD